MAEWLKAADCKSADVVYGGSNPSLPTGFASVAQLVEHQPSKLRVARSNRVTRSIIACVAQ